VLQPGASDCHTSLLSRRSRQPCTGWLGQRPASAQGANALSANGWPLRPVRPLRKASQQPPSASLARTFAPSRRWRGPGLQACGNAVGIQPSLVRGWPHDRGFSPEPTACPVAPTTGQHAVPARHGRGLEPLAKLNLPRPQGPRPRYLLLSRRCQLPALGVFTGSGKNRGCNGVLQAAAASWRRPQRPACWTERSVRGSPS